MQAFVQCAGPSGSGDPSAFLRQLPHLRNFPERSVLCQPATQGSPHDWLLPLRTCLVEQTAKSDRDKKLPKFARSFLPELRSSYQRLHLSTAPAYLDGRKACLVRSSWGTVSQLPHDDRTACGLRSPSSAECTIRSEVELDRDLENTIRVGASGIQCPEAQTSAGAAQLGGQIDHLTG